MTRLQAHTTEVSSLQSRDGKFNPRRGKGVGAGLKAAEMYTVWNSGCEEWDKN